MMGRLVAGGGALCNGIKLNTELDQLGIRRWVSQGERWRGQCGSGGDAGQDGAA
jgi:hypothetical protein